LISSATASSQTDAFNFLSQGAGQAIFEVFLKLYIVLIFVVTVCSLGNRPQGSKWIYALAMFLFGLCNVITLWCAGYTVYLAVPHTIAGWEDFPQLVATNQTFREIVISLVATYGLYLFSSIIHLEPWHMFTSFIQYMFLLPSYVNILSEHRADQQHELLTIVI
jgi:chitin synthase